VNPRTARRLVTASYTSMIAYLTPAIAMPVMKHSGTKATSCMKTPSPVAIAYPTCTPLNTGAGGRKRVIGESHLARSGRGLTSGALSALILVTSGYKGR